VPGNQWQMYSTAATSCSWQQSLSAFTPHVGCGLWPCLVGCIHTSGLTQGCVAVDCTQQQQQQRLTGACGVVWACKHCACCLQDTHGGTQAAVCMRSSCTMTADRWQTMLVSRHGLQQNCCKPCNCLWHAGAECVLHTAAQARLAFVSRLWFRLL
jgi:hypothetical protein